MFRDKKMEPATFAKVVELFGRRARWTWWR
jgi:hypothetical protein